jgi:hypothetical protein
MSKAHFAVPDNSTHVAMMKAACGNVDASYISDLTEEIDCKSCMKTEAFIKAVETEEALGEMIVEGEGEPCWPCPNCEAVLATLQDIPAPGTIIGCGCGANFIIKDIKIEMAQL